MSESRSNYVNKGSDSFSFNVQDSKSGSDESLRLGEALSLNSSSRELGNDNLYEVEEKNVGVHEQPNTEVDSGSDSGGSTNSGKRTYKAALRLQKVYRSFRTRRQLADCAVIIEQKWWKVLDLAELKRSSISFFDIEKHESALSKWSRARTKAAKVGKGLSKDEKARKLALQHWLEAIDPRHRYGHNLQFYYVKWLHCDSSQPFFYWLDIGEGREVDLEICGRSKLLHQCIKYLGPNEREVFEVMVLKGRFFYKKCRSLIDTTAQPKGTKWIFVLSTCKKLYVAQKVKGTFQHSSFLAGGATLSAGRLVVQDGYLTAVWPHSGHYLPTEENFQAFMSFLVEHEVDLTHVQKSPMEEEEESGHKKEIAQMVLSQFKREASRKWEIKDQKRNEAVEKSSSGTADSSDDSSSGYETAEESFLTEVDFTYPKTHIFSDDEDDEFKDAISQEMIFKRINTHRRTKSYQLADQLNSKWTTGAGPRIGCVRDYPSTLQFQAMDHVNLSPRGVRCLNSPGSASLGLRRDLFKVRSPLAFAPDMPSPLASLSEFHSPLSSDFPKDVEFPD